MSKSVHHHSRHGYDGRHGAAGFTSRLRQLCPLWHYSEKHFQTSESSKFLGACRVAFHTHQSNSHTLLNRQLHYSQPVYLHSILCFYDAACSLRSSNTNRLTVPFARTALGAGSFSVCLPKCGILCLQLNAPATVPTLSAESPTPQNSLLPASLFIP